jgi:hypothetical protein
MSVRCSSCSSRHQWSDPSGDVVAGARSPLSLCGAAHSGLSSSLLTSYVVDRLASTPARQQTATNAAAMSRRIFEAGGGAGGMRMRELDHGVIGNSDRQRASRETTWQPRRSTTPAQRLQGGRDHECTQRSVFRQHRFSTSRRCTLQSIRAVSGWLQPAASRRASARANEESGAARDHSIVPTIASRPATSHAIDCSNREHAFPQSPFACERSF